jgi:hypothetical protein
MLIAAAWTMFALGVGHVVVGLVLFKRQFANAAGEGWIGRFQGVDSRRLAFWFTVFGPLVMMGGQIAVHAVQQGDMALLKLIGYYLCRRRADGCHGAAEVTVLGRLGARAGVHRRRPRLDR